MGESAQQNTRIETVTNKILQQHSFIGADVNAACFDLSLSYLHAYIIQ
jgi:hypothetical protein